MANNVLRTDECFDGSSAECDFCVEFGAERVAPRYLETYGYPADGRIIYENDNFVLVSDLVPIVDGHLLLVPRHHHLGLSGPAQDGPAELIEFASIASRAMAVRHPQISILEHGSSGQGASGSCVEHAHWHMVPRPMSRLLPLVVEDLGQPTYLTEGGLSNAVERLGTLDKGVPYFMISDVSVSATFVEPTLPSHQYARSVVARSDSRTEPSSWDWAANPNPASLTRSVLEARSSFATTV